MYGGGIKHNFRAVVKAMTFRRNAIFQARDDRRRTPLVHRQHAAAADDRGRPVRRAEKRGHRRPRGPGAPGRAVEHCVCGDQSARRRRREASTRRDADVLEAGLPKIAVVVDTDVDVWDDNAVQFAMAFRYMPHVDTVQIPNCNTMTVDPMISELDAPGRPRRSGSTAPFRSARTTCARTSTAVRSSHSPRRRPASPSSAGQIDRSHGRFHPGTTAGLEGDPRALQRPAVQDPLPRVQQPAPPAGPL